MEYTANLITNEISRLQKRLEDDQSYLESAIASVARRQDDIEYYKSLLEELQTVLVKLEEGRI